MELQEAINHALEVSEKEEECDICKSEHKQLADWLVELKDLRNILGDNYNIYELKDLIEVCWENECHNGSVDYNRLRELVEADREGRCVVLPAKTVFELVWCAGEGCDMVCPIRIDGKGCCDFCDNGVLIVEEVTCRQEHIERIGADVFLTSADAEAALRREQE